MAACRCYCSEHIPGDRFCTGDATSSRGWVPVAPNGCAVAPSTSQLLSEIEFLRRERDELHDLLRLQAGGLAPEPFDKSDARSAERRYEFERLVAAQEATAAMQIVPDSLMTEREFEDQDSREWPRRPVWPQPSATAWSSAPSQPARPSRARSARASMPITSPQNTPIYRHESYCDETAPARVSSRGASRRSPSPDAPTIAIAGLPQGSGFHKFGHPDGCGPSSQGSRPPRAASAPRRHAVGASGFTSVSHFEPALGSSGNPWSSSPLHAATSTEAALLSNRVNHVAATHSPARVEDVSQEVLAEERQQEALHDAFERAIRGLGGARGALADAAFQLGVEAQRRSAEARRLKRLEQAMGASMAGLGREVRSLREERRPRAQAQPPRARCRSCTRA